MLSERDVDFIKKLARQIAMKHSTRVVQIAPLADKIAQAIIVCIEAKTAGVARREFACAFAGGCPVQGIVYRENYLCRYCSND